MYYLFYNDSKVFADKLKDFSIHLFQMNHSCSYVLPQYLFMTSFVIDNPIMYIFFRGSMAENNFQLRVRKRGAAENNFQLRVRKDFMDRLRNPPQIRSSAEDNFQLRVRRKPSSAERNFQLRVRRSDPNLSLRQTFLEKIRERRFQPLAADKNFQLRVRRSPELT